VTRLQEVFAGLYFNVFDRLPLLHIGSGGCPTGDGNALINDFGNLAIAEHLRLFEIGAAGMKADNILEFGLILPAKVSNSILAMVLGLSKLLYLRST
jgi:hypothetical protein